ncbi:hypothetical protein SAMN05216371_6437 [Streptomyces sp. TLI_053]|uniref:hypothetical protein n=1 Tax=Streptomyces sp. TLI_053 TaxID=1855352 RepID=UPI00087924C0|nr:hypothetical protein [Streptomyces sp. TLI_053]SDT80779.1 hypothetical protein SAMN05216371_6437 [Streptomyces sp. TLI_053]
MTGIETPRRLFHALESHRGDDAFAALVAPWLRHSGAAAADGVAPLARYGEWRREAYAFGDPLERAYALQRLNDVLLLGFQPGLPPGSGEVLKHLLHLDHEWPRITLDQYLTLFTGLGMTPVEESAFTPFHHEIVSVEQAEDADAPITVTDTVWPGLMLGELMFSRSGVRVRAGSRHATAGVADRSTLHRVFLRRHRGASDGSEFFGFNSQWKTDFRRDYRTATAYHYNVDGTADADTLGPDQGLSPTEHRDLLRHRCLVRPPADPAAHPHPTPADLRLTEARA